MGRMHTMVGKIVTLVVIIIMAVGLAVAPASARASSSSGTVTLTYRLWDPNEQIGYQQSINLFEKKYPTIKVRIEQVPYGDYFTKLTTEFAAGNAPDVFWDQIPRFPDFVREGALLDLTPYIRRDHVNTDIYFQNLLKAYQYQGHQYGLPKDWDTIALVYNKTLLRKMGVTMPSTLTWRPDGSGTFLPLLRKLTVDTKGRRPTQTGFDPNHVKQYGFVAVNTNQQQYWNYIAMNGGSIMTKPFGQFAFDGPQANQALQFLVNLILKWHVSPSAAETNPPLSNPDIQLFAAQRAAIIEVGDWNVSFLSKQTNFPVGIAPLPSGPAGRVSVFNGLADAIYAKTKHPQEAWELFKWLASPASQKILGSGGYIWPAVKNLDSTYQDYWRGKGIDVSPYLEEANGKTISYPVTPGYTAAAQKIDNIFNLMYLGQLPVAAATTQAVQAANQAVQQAANGG